MHILLFLYLIFHPCTDTNTSPILWTNTKHWKIYALNNSQAVFSIPADSMRRMKAMPLDDDSMHILLNTAKPLHVPGSPAWMGCYLTSCEDKKGTFMKIIVSQYGGFFLNSLDREYYQLDPASSRDWLNYMRRAYIKAE